MQVYRSPYRIVDHAQGDKVVEEGYHYHFGRIEPCAVIVGAQKTLYEQGSAFSEHSPGHDYKTFVLGGAWTRATATFDASGAYLVNPEGERLSAGAVYERAERAPDTRHYMDDDERIHPSKA